MARNTNFIPYDEDIVEAYDEEPNDPGSLTYGSSPSMAEDDYPFSEDPMPLFLSGGAEEPRQRGFGTGGERLLRRSVVWPRVFKASLFAATAAAIGFAILSVGNPLALFADAKASLPSATADQSGAAPTVNPQPAAVQQIANAGPTPVLPSGPAVRTSPPAARVTRDDIALALRTAQQNQVQAQARSDPPPPETAAAPATPARRLGADELAMLMTRAKGMIAIGDIASARLLLERAADAQEAGAALLLAQTYDPVVLGTQDMRSITPDPAKARDWYQTAARLGSADARQRLAQMN